MALTLLVLVLVVGCCELWNPTDHPYNIHDVLQSSGVLVSIELLATTNIKALVGSVRGGSCRGDTR